MLLLNQHDIAACFSMKEAIDAAKTALKLYTQGDATVPLRTNIPVTPYNGQSLFMPATTSGDATALGIKIVSVFPENQNSEFPVVPATMLVMDPKHGVVSALLDGTYLTQLRTGAVQGAATDLLAREDAQIAALIGTGGQATQQAIAMMTVRPLTQLRVYDIDFERAQQFAQSLADAVKEEFSTQIIAVQTAKEAVQDADIITSVTTSKVPTFDAADVKKGAHVNGIGAYTPEMKELPSELLVAADAVFFDTRDGVLAEAGDILAPIQDGTLTEDDYTGELGELLIGNIQGRTDDTHITVFKSVGSAVLDVVTAQKIVEQAQQRNIGTTITI